MIDSYIIMNRKPTFLIRLFLINIVIIGSIVIYGINTFHYKTYFHIHSKILKINNNYYAKILIPVKEVNKIAKESTLIINNVTYNYKIYKIESNVIYKNNINYQNCYLEIDKLKNNFLFDGYELELKIYKDSKKIIDYFK